MNCHIVKDLLPNYIDELISDETKNEMQEHLKNCPECRIIYEQMNKPLESMTARNDVEEIDFLKKIKANTRKKIAIIVGGLILSFCILTWVFAIGMPADFGDVAAMTEFQRAEDYGLVAAYLNDVYLKQEWVIHFKLINGNALRVKNKYTYEKNERGENIETGCIIALYEVQPSVLSECDNYTMGYFYDSEEGPPSDFDYKITVRYRGKDMVYSMRDEGLFEPQ